MKKLIVLLLPIVLFACGNNGEEKSSANTTPDPQVALNVLNGYVANCNAMKDSEEWVKNQPLLTADFKAAYHQMITDAWEDDPELGLGFDPIFNAQDYPEKGFKLASGTSPDNSMVVLEGIDMNMTVKVKLKEVNGKWLVDGAGVIRLVDK